MMPTDAVPDEVWELFQSLSAETLPRKHAIPIKRVTSLAHALTADGLVPDAGNIARKRLHGVLNGLAAHDLVKALEDMLTVAGGTVRGQARHGMRCDESWTEDADDRAIQDYYQSGARTITPDVARSYVEHLTADDEDDYRDAYVWVVALATLPQTRAKLDEDADAISKEWLERYRGAIKSLPESRLMVRTRQRSIQHERWSETAEV